MTLPLRKKLLTTVQSTRSLAKLHRSKHLRARALLKHSLWLGLLLSSNVSQLQAQAPGWQPNRLPPSSSMQPLTGNAHAPVANQPTSTSSATSDQGNSGVVLRWRTSPRANDGSQSTNQSNTGSTVANQVAPTASSSLAARALDANNMRASTSTQPSAQAAQVQAAQYTARASADFNSTAPTTSGASNPLRSTAATNNLRATTVAANTFVPRGTHVSQRSAVQPANFQAPAGNAPQVNMPQAPGNNGLLDNNAIAPPSFPNNPSGLQAPPSLDPPATLPPSTFPQDALNVPENAPAPPVAPPAQDGFPKTLGNAPAQDANSAAPMPGTDNELRLPDNSSTGNVPPKEDATDPFRNRRKDDLESPSDREGGRKSRDLEKRKDQGDSSANCEAFRDKLRNSSIQKINLNAAPRYGQGLSDDPEKSEKQRLDFAASSELRDWCDRSGRTVIQGRMIDLLNEQVVLDVNGVRREIPLRDLCDVDLAYVGKVWHLPITCGSGDEQFAGRSFVPSAVQWKASGLCHKPLYFEEVQLERYGHEIGPILQPLVSTAHFFGNIAVLPYKMGIHPPHECQYSLGYYRPGDCAPYMLPPVPISLRGAALQAGAVVGGAALLP